jgi:hypothetical protein
MRTLPSRMICSTLAGSWLNTTIGTVGKTVWRCLWTSPHLSSGVGSSGGMPRCSIKPVWGKRLRYSSLAQNSERRRLTMPVEPWGLRGVYGLLDTVRTGRACDATGRPRNREYLCTICEGPHPRCSCPSVANRGGSTMANPAAVNSVSAQLQQYQPSVSNYQQPNLVKMALKFGSLQLKYCISAAVKRSRFALVPPIHSL